MTVPAGHPHRPFSFVKMEGCGNDYVFVDAGFAVRELRIEDLGDLSVLAVAVSDRHRGIGSDGLILLTEEPAAPLAMHMYNADGSEGRLCLNGLRCAAKYAADVKPEMGDAFEVSTRAGVRRVRVFRADTGRVSEVEVDAGRPDFRRASIPARGAGDRFWAEPVAAAGRTWTGYGVSVGNPHLVLWMDDEAQVQESALESIGPELAGDSLFPDGVNVHLVAARDLGGLRMRSYERGSGLTLACGSGATASFAVARALERVPSQAPVQMPGGTVTLREETEGRLVLRGPAREIFSGTWTQPY